MYICISTYIWPGEKESKSFLHSNNCSILKNTVWSLLERSIVKLSLNVNNIVKFSAPMGSQMKNDFKTQEIGKQIEKSCRDLDEINVKFV